MNQITKTILDQIGNRALQMLGAFDVMYSNDANTISFKIRGSKKANYIKVSYDKISDLYNMTFIKMTKYEIKNEKNIDGVYADQMHQIIEMNTGLYTSL